MDFVVVGTDVASNIRKHRRVDGPQEPAPGNVPYH